MNYIPKEVKQYLMNTMKELTLPLKVNKLEFHSLALTNMGLKILAHKLEKNR